MYPAYDASFVVFYHDLKPVVSTHIFQGYLALVGHTITHNEMIDGYG